ncbi:MAG TPA: LysR family transcriptional regulator [Xanthobacteraceae bacterium]|jgi:DNA-binding transcriptional LysR family regulator
MEIHRFRHILILAEEGNFARAAARLGMAQPPLSQSIQRSERDLGVALFKRTRKGVYLTAAGQALLPEARAAVAAAERAAELARAAVLRHAVRIGVASPCLWGPFPELLRLAYKAGIPIEVIEASTNEQLQALPHGRLDLGFLSPPFDAPARLHVIDMSTDPLIAAVPKKLVASHNAVPLSLLAGRLILFPQQQGPSLHAKILNYFSTHGLRPTIVQQVSDLMPTLALVAAGLGSTFVPSAMGRRVSLRDVMFRPVAEVDNVPTWPFAIAHMPLSAGSDVAKLLNLWKQARIL